MIYPETRTWPRVFPRCDAVSVFRTRGTYTKLECHPSLPTPAAGWWGDLCNGEAAAAGGQLDRPGRTDPSETMGQGMDAAGARCPEDLPRRACEVTWDGGPGGRPAAEVGGVWRSEASGWGPAECRCPNSYRIR